MGFRSLDKDTKTVVIMGKKFECGDHTREISSKMQQ